MSRESLQRATLLGVYQDLERLHKELSGLGGDMDIPLVLIKAIEKMLERLEETQRKLGEVTIYNPHPRPWRGG